MYYYICICIKSSPGNHNSPEDDFIKGKKYDYYLYESRDSSTGLFNNYYVVNGVIFDYYAFDKHFINIKKLRDQKIELILN